MVIDDDPISNLVCERMIKTNRYAQEVISFLQAEEGLKFLQNIIASDANGWPEIIFLDINMPEMDGWEFLEHYQQLPESFRNRCKLFMLSSSIDKEDIQKSTQYADVQGYITKPLTRANLAKYEHIFAAP
jgi:CheY-like chemotaxis protein